jgi:pimeloyl-ACP methyl ester carboxylesterase
MQVSSLSAKPILIGHSAGGGMVQRYLSKHTDAAKGGVVFCGFPPRGGHQVFFDWMNNVPGARSAMLQGAAMRRPVVAHTRGLTEHRRASNDDV